MSRFISAVVATFGALLILSGAILIFAPDEVAALVGSGQEEGAALWLTLLGAALFGHGQLNWMQRNAPLGGIYGRPVVMANLAHFVVGGLALLRYCLDGNAHAAYWVAAIVYLAGAGFFGRLLFAAPPQASTR